MAGQQIQDRRAACSTNISGLGRPGARARGYRSPGWGKMEERNRHDRWATLGDENSSAAGVGLRRVGKAADLGNGYAENETGQVDVKYP